MIDSAYEIIQFQNVCSRKVIHKYFGETIPGESGTGKLFHECCAYGNGRGKTSVVIPEI